MVEIVAALRVKNEARWIAEVLESIKWCLKTYLFDDHSTDDTPQIAKDCSAEVLLSPFIDFDEARDKEWLTAKIADNHPQGTWVLMIDGDEILEAAGEGKIKRSIAANPKMLSFKLPVKYFWNSRDCVRVDGVYGRLARPSLFKLIGNYSFSRSGIKGNLHPSCAPVACRKSLGICSAILWHLGYMDKEDRIRKWKYYNSLDPKNLREGYDHKHPERGSYPHMVQGDIPEVPAGARLLHSGPLQLRAL